MASPTVTAAPVGHPAAVVEAPASARGPRRRDRRRHRTPYANVQREARLSRWSSRLLWVAVLGGWSQVAGIILLRRAAVAPSSVRALIETEPLGVGLVAGGTAVMAPVAVLFLAWLYRAVANARDLGLPERRRPGLVVLGMCIPVVNLFVPYRAAAGLFEPTDRRRRRAARWWTRLLAAQIGLVALVLVPAEPVVVLYAVGTATAVAYLGAAWSARRLMTTSVDAHHSLVSCATVPTLVPRWGSLRRGDLPDDAATDAAWEVFVSDTGRGRRRGRGRRGRRGRRRPKLA